MRKLKISTDEKSILNIGTIKKVKRLVIPHLVGKGINVLIKLLPILSIIIPISLLYLIDPASFERTWKGRTYYLIFVWLTFLETMLYWEQLQKDSVSKGGNVRKVILILTFLISTIYVIIMNYGGINNALMTVAWKNGVSSESLEYVPLFMEYLVFTAAYTFFVLIEHGLLNLAKFSLSITFLGLIGIVYTIDTLYPYGKFTPFQILVPTTARIAATILNLMGYQVIWTSTIDGMPRFLIMNSAGRVSAPLAIAWPCSGIDSLLIYTAVILLFLKNTAIPLKHRIVYFGIGAAVTYFVNILRIVTIFLISLNGGDIWSFHNLYGPLYSIIWILSYPLIIILIQILRARFREH
jgi:exosortase/archaeosortase family protein